MFAGIRKVGVALLVGVASLSSAGVAAVATADPSGAATCTNSWQGPTTGTTDWNASAANWSAGFPTSTGVTCINLPGTYTVALRSSANLGALQVGGGAGGTQTVQVDGSATNVAMDLAAPSTVAGAGRLILSPSTGYALLSGTGGLTVNSGGSFATSGATAIAYVRTNLTNQSGGTITIGAANTLQDQGTTSTNNGTLAVSAASQLTTSGGGGITNSGPIVLTGTMSIGNSTFTQSNGSISGNPVVLTGGGTLADAGGTGNISVVGSTNMSGAIPSGQTVTVDGSNTNVIFNVTSAMTDSGTLALKPATGYAIMQGSDVTIASGGVLKTTGTANIAYLRTNITNQAGGTVTISAPDTRQDQSTTTTNNGTFTVASGGVLAVSAGGGITNTGTMAVTGSLIVGNSTFTQTSGSISGNAVVLSGNSTLVDTTGAGAFDVIGSSTLTGNVPVGQTVTVDGSVTNVILALSGATTVSGVLKLNPATGFALLVGSGGVTVASGGVFTTTGTANIAYLRTNITNQAGGTVTISAPDTRQDQGTTTTNNGTLRVTDGGHLGLSGGSTLSTSSGATLGVAVNGTSNVASGISGPGVSLAGTLSVTTAGTPTLGHQYIPISGPSVGTFSTLSFGGTGYNVTYPASSVLLTVTAVFTTTPTPLAPKENIALVTPQVASIANATAGTGTYSATVNYGDGGGLVAATVALSGANGTVTGPNHTYTAPGTYTVQTSVANTNGTTQVTSESVVVTGPTVTSFSPTKVVHGQKLVTVVTGTGFDATAVATVSNPGVTVTLTKFISSTKLKLKMTTSISAVHGWFTVTITQTNGTVTVVHALKVK